MDKASTPDFDAREIQFLQLADRLEKAGMWMQAIAALGKILSQRPDCLPVHIEMGNILHRNGQFGDAIKKYVAVLRLDGGNHDALYNLGNAYSDDGQPDKALECYRKAVEIRPDSALAWKELGVALQQQGDIRGADAAYSKALRIQPDFAAAHANRGNLYARQGLIGKAVESYKRALALDPSLHQIHSNLLFFINFDPSFTQDAIFKEYRLWNDRYAKPLFHGVHHHPPLLKKDRVRRPLRIGYVSPDFRDHVIGSYMEPILKYLDRGKFEVFIYSDVAKPDETTARLRAYRVAWRDCANFSHEQLADKIREDKIDILVDLSGHMSGNRLLVFARRPAPVQVTALGYPRTTGIDAMDARVSDIWMDPAGVTERFHVEKLYRLERCAFCYTALENSPEVGAIPSLSNGGITFGSMNNFAKVSDVTIQAWARILEAVPSSRLLILIQGGENNRDVVAGRFGSFGVDASRLILEGLRPRRDYLELHNRIDINLDPFPYNGGITTFESLWMGVPVVTLAGDSQVGRHGVSIYENLGVREWIAKDVEEYVRIAVALSGDEEKLLEVKKGLRAQMQSSSLMDGEGYCQELGAVYEKIWNDA